jgi:hypothetical protein
MIYAIGETRDERSSLESRCEDGIPYAAVLGEGAGEALAC